MQKIITFWLCFFICMAFTSVKAQNGIKPAGTGLIDSPYIISTPENFYWILENSIYNSYKEILDGKFLELSNDITIEGAKIPNLEITKSIRGDYNSVFTGILDGKGNSVEITGIPKTLFSNIYGASTVAEVKNLTVSMVDDVQGMPFAYSISNAIIENVTVSVDGHIGLLQPDNSIDDYFAAGFAYSISESTMRNVKTTANFIGNYAAPSFLNINGAKSPWDGIVRAVGFAVNFSNSNIYNSEVNVSESIYADGNTAITSGAIYKYTADKRDLSSIIDGFTINIGNENNNYNGDLGSSSDYGSTQISGFVNVIAYNNLISSHGIKISNIDINIYGRITGSSYNTSNAIDRISGFMGVYEKNISNDGGNIDLIKPIFENIDINVKNEMRLSSGNRSNALLCGFTNEVTPVTVNHLKIKIEGSVRSTADNVTTVMGLGTEVIGNDIDIHIIDNMRANSYENSAFAFGLCEILTNANNIRLYIGGNLSASCGYKNNIDVKAIGAAETINSAKNVGIVIDGDLYAMGNGGPKTFAIGFGHNCNPSTSILENLSVTVHGDIYATTAPPPSKNQSPSKGSTAMATGFIGKCKSNVNNCTVYIGGSVFAQKADNIHISTFINTLAKDCKIQNSAAFLGGTLESHTWGDITVTENIGMFVGTCSGTIEESTLILSPEQPGLLVDPSRYVNFVGTSNAKATYINNFLVEADGQLRSVYMIRKNNSNNWVIRGDLVHSYLLNKNYDEIYINVDDPLNTTFLMVDDNISSIYGHGSVGTTTTDNYKTINIRDNKAQIGFNGTMDDGARYTFDILQVSPAPGDDVAVISHSMVAYQGGTSLASGRYPRPYCFIIKDGVELTLEEGKQLQFYVNGNLFVPFSQEAQNAGFFYEYPFYVDYYDQYGNYIPIENLPEDQAGTYSIFVYPPYGDEITVKENLPDATLRRVIFPTGNCTLEIRPVLTPSDNPPYLPVTTTEPTGLVVAPTAIVPNNVNFKNSAGVDILNDGVNSNVTLLMDYVYDVDKIEVLANEVRNNDFTKGMSFQLVYLDLVDTKNGNIVVDSDQSTVIYLPYLAHTTAANPYKILHFKNIRGNAETGNVNDVEEITPEKTAFGLKFTTTDFGPFALATEYEINATVTADPVDGIKYGTISYKETNVDGTIYAGDGDHIFKFIPNSEHYFVSKLTIDGLNVAVADSVKFSNLTAPHNIIVEFSLDSHKIIATKNNGGSINDEGEIILRHGSNKSYTITPDVGYVISNVSIDGISIGTPNSYTFNNLTDDHSISVNFSCISGIPYSENFDNSTIATLPDCTASENAGEGNDWSIGHITSYGFKSKVLLYVYNTKNAANAWFYTAGIELKAGKTYTLNFKYGNNSTKKTEKLKVCYGTLTHHSKMTTELFNKDDINQMIMAEADIKFSPATDGIYYFGFNAYSDVNQWNLFVDDISIFEGNKISILASEGGSIIPVSSNDVTLISSDEFQTNLAVDFNGNIKLNITPDEGYKIDNIILDGKNIGIIDSYTFENVYQPHTIAASFSQLAPTGVEESESVVANIYSYNKDIKIFISNEMSANIEISDLTGRIIVNKQIHGGENVININQSGIYLIKLVTDNGMIKTEKVIIK